MNKEVKFLQFLIENLVKNVEDIKISREEDELWILLTLKVNSDDMGLIIWKWGNTVNSIRSLLKVLGSKKEKRINLKVLD